MLGVYILSCFLSCSASYYLWRRVTFNIFISLPILIVVIFYNLFGEEYGFIKLNNELYVYLSIFVALGCLAESFIVISCYKLYNNYHVDVRGLNVPKIFCYFVILLSLAILSAAFKFSVEFGLTSDEFERKMSSGLVGHSLIFLMVVPPFIYISYRNGNIGRKILFVGVVLIFSCLFLKQVKSWIMIPAVYFFFMYIYYNKIGIKRILSYCTIIALILIILFFAVYIFKTMMSNSEANIGELLNQIYIHFLFYLFSGVGAFSAYLNDNISANADMWYVLFLPVLNVINLISGQPMLSPVNTLSYAINYNLSSNANVFTMFGTMWMYSNYSSFFLYVLLVMFQSFLFLRRNSIICCNVFFMITSFGFFSWFEYYYFQLPAYEAPIFIVILSSLFLVKKCKVKH